MASEKTCYYCKGRAYTKKPVTIITAYGKKFQMVFEYCPNCGRKLRMMEGEKPEINLHDDLFGAVLNCAVRYAIGRQTYMPGLVIDFITPLIPHLNDKTLWCFDQDVTEAEYTGGYGNPDIDEPHWRKFHEAVRAERTKRGHTLYKSWRTLPYNKEAE